MTNKENGYLLIDDAAFKYNLDAGEFGHVVGQILANAYGSHNLKLFLSELVKGIENPNPPQPPDDWVC